jgi:DNA-binding Xre family transcriptional regulator
MVAKQVAPKGRARFRGDHLVPVKSRELVAALEAKQEQLGISQVDLMKQMGLATTFLAVMKQRKQGAVFSTNLKRISDFLGVNEETFLRGSGAGQGAKRRTTTLHQMASTAIVHETVDFVERLKAAPAEERQIAEKLLKYLLDN